MNLFSIKLYICGRIYFQLKKQKNEKNRIYFMFSFYR